MSDLYAHVDENGLVDYRGELPRNWKHVSGLNLATDQEFLQSLGWVPLVIIEPDLGPNQVKDGETVAIDFDPPEPDTGPIGLAVRVTITEGKRDLTQKEIKETAQGIWERDMRISDDFLPRWAEDLYDGMSKSARKRVAVETQVKIAAKKRLRLNRPK